MKASTIAATVLVASLAACSREPAPTVSPVRITPPPTSETSQPIAQPVPAPVAPTAPAEPAPAVPGGASATPSLIEAYNKALFEYCQRVSDIPSDLADLKQRRALPPLPVPPPGKRLIYKPDLKTMDYRTARLTLE